MTPDLLAQSLIAAALHAGPRLTPIAAPVLGAADNRKRRDVMASSDYKLCDVCGGKAFYDVDIRDSRYIATYDPLVAREYAPIGLAVLCSDCNKTHEAMIRKRGEA